MKEIDVKPHGNSINQQVSTLYNLMRSENLDELEIKENDFYLYIKRKSKSTPQAPAAAQAYVPAVAGAPASDTSAQGAPVSGTTIKSPIIGVFYQTPSPSSPPFLKEGDVIEAGKTMCIIEAMKVMNEIKADYRLKVLKIIVENGKPITAGQDLFLVEKA